MTRKRFNLYRNLLIAAFLGVPLLYLLTSCDIWKNVALLFLPLFVAIFTFIYQKRMSFLLQLRSVWKDLLYAVQDAIQFTHLEKPTKEQYANVRKQLSVAIDNFRSLYTNINETNNSIGLYPFEPLKEIYNLVEDHYTVCGVVVPNSNSGKENGNEEKGISFEKFREDSGPKIRKRIINRWESVRSSILKEFDRPQPTYIDTPYLTQKNN